MRKRTRRKVVDAESGGWLGRGLVVTAISALLVIFLGWWVLFSPSQSRVKKGCLSRLSMMVDRFDQLSEAWQNRKVHDLNDTRKKRTLLDPLPAPTSRPPLVSPSPLSSSPQEGTTAEDKTASIPPESQSAPPPSPSPPEKPIRPANDDVSSEDKEQLKALLQSQKSDHRPKKESPSSPAPEPGYLPGIPPAAPSPPLVPGDIAPEDQKALRDLLKSLE